MLKKEQSKVISRHIRKLSKKSHKSKDNSSMNTDMEVPDEVQIEDFNMKDFTDIELDTGMKLL